MLDDDCAYEKGWLQAFFDGEGHIHLRKRCKTPRRGTDSIHTEFYISASNTDQELIERASEFLSRLGIPHTVQGPYMASPGRKPYSRVMIRSKPGAARFARLVGFHTKRKSEKLLGLLEHVRDIYGTGPARNYKENRELWLDEMRHLRANPKLLV